MGFQRWRCPSIILWPSRVFAPLVRFAFLDGNQINQDQPKSDKKISSFSSLTYFFLTQNSFETKVGSVFHYYLRFLSE